jgi:hypothetical protein
MSEQGIRGAYTECAEEYARVLGSVEQMAIADRRRIEEWADAGGAVLLGFFDGPRIEAFDHAITTGHFWPVAVLGRLLEEAGLAVTAVEQRADGGARPHGAIEARKALGT